MSSRSMKAEDPRVQCAKQGSETLSLKWDWVEATIWTERMLTALEKGVKGGKWFSLWDKIYAKPTLAAAWVSVRRNGGCAGIDRITVQRFESKANEYLEEIHEALKSGTYVPGDVKRVYIPKGNKGHRPLGIPTVKDRIVQAAMKMALEPIFENDFSEHSYGFRPKRGAKDALREVDGLLKEGNVWVVDADIKSYFDMIPHDKLLQELGHRVSDGRVIELTERFLEQKIVEELKRWTPTQGTPQGGVLSPLLANIYLHPLDKLMEEQGTKMVRYADDFVILCKSEREARTILQQIQSWVESRGLELHPEKTHVGNCLIEGQGFEFLGYRFEAGRRYVRKKSLMKLKDGIRQKTPRNYGNSLEKAIETLNPMLKGWFEYFKHTHKTTFLPIDAMIRRRLRAILRTQSGRPGMGNTRKDHMLWRNNFFASKGLFSLQQAYTQARQSR